MRRLTTHVAATPRIAMIRLMIASRRSVARGSASTDATGASSEKLHGVPARRASVAMTLPTPGLVPM
jgi:hypothetical protein